MRRRLPEAADGFPPQLAEFSIGDWWVADPEDPTEQGYARIRWAVARRAYLLGEDWWSDLGPPVWWGERGVYRGSC